VPDVVKVNDVGDVVLEYVGQLTALADPERLALFTRLQRHGPADVARLAAELERDLDSVTAALERLAAAGLVEATREQWRAPGRGLFLQLPDGDPEAARAARQLSSVMLLAVEHLPRQWVDEEEPRLDDAWAGAAGLFNAGVALTSDELNHLQEDLEELMLPYLNRSAADRPEAARQVRVLAYFLPGAGA
jgi:predicted transcriptional regulator